jgi:hypothetical protein
VRGGEGFALSGGLTPVELLFDTDHFGSGCQLT